RGIKIGFMNVGALHNRSISKVLWIRLDDRGSNLNFLLSRKITSRMLKYQLEQIHRQPIEMSLGLAMKDFRPYDAMFVSFVRCRHIQIFFFSQKTRLSKYFGKEYSDNKPFIFVLKGLSAFNLLHSE